jgi:peptidoglycan/LPS O-acetylase OafA/YrhL
MRTSQSQPQTHSRLRSGRISEAVDAGRVLAASAIFYYHVGIATGFRFHLWGEYAVGYFIFLAGFCYVLFSRPQVSPLSRYLNYLGRRALTIMPTFVVVNALIFAGSFVLPSGLNRHFFFNEFLLSTLGLSQYFGLPYESSVMWFLPFILQVYALLPLLDSLSEKWYPMPLFIIATLLSLLCSVVTFHAFPDLAWGVCRNWSPAFRLHEVLLGLFVGKALLGQLRLGTLTGIIFLYLSAASVLFSFSFSHAVFEAYIMSLPLKSFVATSVLILLSVGFSYLCPSNTKRIVKFLGLASLPFFLTHAAMIRFVFSRFGPEFVVWAIYFCFCWTGSSIWVILWRALDPFRRIGERQSPSNCDCTELVN